MVLEKHKMYLKRIKIIVTIKERTYLRFININIYQTKFDHTKRMKSQLI